MINVTNLVYGERASVWCVVNSSDKRILITYSPSTILGINHLMHKMYYRNKYLNKQMIQDYKDNKLEIKVIEYVQKLDRGDVVVEVLKQQHMQQWADAGYSLYNEKSPTKLFISLVAVEQYALVGDKKEMYVYALLKPKRIAASLSKHKIVGVFPNFPSGKAWCKEYYGAYENTCAKSLIICNNKYTKRYYTNPVVQDVALLDTYKNLFKIL
jgi:hypothetical protein